VDDLELATLSWVSWFNQTRLHSSIGHVPPIEYENQYYGQNNRRARLRVGAGRLKPSDR
jgi:putative transposase